MLNIITKHIIKRQDHTITINYDRSIIEIIAIKIE